MATLTVSGFGTSAVNGTYPQSGTFNGNPYYSLVSGGHTWYILWHNPDWWLKMDFLEADETNGAAYYYTLTASLTGSWSNNVGSLPNGTVTMLSSATSNLTLLGVG